MRPSLGPHDRAPLGLSPCPPLPWGTGHAHASWAPSLPFDCPLRNLAWARGLALSTFSHPECEALWTAGRLGGSRSHLPGPRGGAPAPGRRQWRKPGAQVLQLCLHYKLKTLSSHPCSPALPDLRVESRLGSHPDRANTSVLPSAMWSPGYRASEFV